MTYTVRIKHGDADTVLLSYERYSEAAREFWQTVAMQDDDGCFMQPVDESTLMSRVGIDDDRNRWHVELIDASERLNRAFDAEVARRDAADTTDTKGKRS